MVEKYSRKVGKRTMREEIAIIAGQRGFNDNRKSDLSRAFDELAERGSKISRRMLKALFYSEKRNDEKHWAAIEIRELAKVIEAKREAASLATQLETIIHRLDTSDPDFHQPTIDALRGAVSAWRGKDRA